VNSEETVDGFVASRHGTYQRPRQLLVSAKHAERVEQQLRRDVGGWARYDDSDDVGLVCFEWDDDELDVREVGTRLKDSSAREWEGWRPLISANHLVATDLDVVTGQPVDIGGPATKVKPADGTLPRRVMTRVGEGVTVGVIDTGIAPHPWMEDAVVATADDIETPHVDVNPRNGELDDQAGHGTFIAGLVLRQAPGATIRAARVLNSRGRADAREVAKAVARLARAGVDIINLSAGSYTPTNVPPMAMQLALAGMKPTSVLVAAAGNHDPLNDQHKASAPTRPMWPAALETVIAVGALDRTGQRRAPWSNYGPWVDVFTRGEDLMSTFLTFHGGSQQFDGWATWSGTSFAAPMVAGAIAARMTTDGVSAAHAAQMVLAEVKGNRFYDYDVAPDQEDLPTLGLPPLI
jgi:subtilisin family serine protease